MRLASYVLSLCLHLAVLLLVLFWPQRPLLRLDAPSVMISLVEGPPGGNRTLSPILGHMGAQSDDALKAPEAPAPKAEIVAPERALAQDLIKIPEPPKDRAAPIKKPDVKPEPKTVTTHPKPTSKIEEKPKKEEKKTDLPKPPNVDPITVALEQAQRKASSRADSGDRGNAIERALAQAQRRAGGNRGGGGGEGDGPGGGGLGDVYIGQVMLAVRPNWGFASAGRANLICVVRVKIDMQGKVLQAVFSQGSGNSQFDASAVNAVLRTGQAGQFPPPPSQQYTDLDLVFTLDELIGR
ncbi:MAG: Tol-Pal system inner membrane component TolA [Candidatus Desulfovibrio kirbyi]|uniref:Tol-Pal system inner membrane component TolA n=1 Tax=Candidatus Desulfovibrio kirbyi TaxID=2696086 RepID=A0A6L2R6A9_9BACT|nr:MAG: Tol-Pal system inner membrane component TolA [Candidatus Desulfovibrio kirbyi]